MPVPNPIWFGSWLIFDDQLSRTKSRKEVDERLDGKCTCGTPTGGEIQEDIDIVASEVDGPANDGNPDQLESEDETEEVEEIERVQPTRVALRRLGLGLPLSSRQFAKSKDVTWSPTQMIKSTERSPAVNFINTFDRPVRCTSLVETDDIVIDAGGEGQVKFAPTTIYTYLVFLFFNLSMDCL